MSRWRGAYAIPYSSAAVYIGQTSICVNERLQHTVLELFSCGSIAYHKRPMRWDIFQCMCTIAGVLWNLVGLHSVGVQIAAQDKLGNCEKLQKREMNA